MEKTKTKILFRFEGTWGNKIDKILFLFWKVEISCFIWGFYTAEKKLSKGLSSPSFKKASVVIAWVTCLHPWECTWGEKEFSSAEIYTLFPHVFSLPFNLSHVLVGEKPSFQLCNYRALTVSRISIFSLGKDKRDNRRAIYTVHIVTYSVGTSGMGLIMGIQCEAGPYSSLRMCWESRKLLQTLMPFSLLLLGVRSLDLACYYRMFMYLFT